jgi:hypothetical protein
VFHQVVSIGVFPEVIFDPSYGTRTEKTDSRTVGLKYEDENITHLRGEDTWIADPKGTQQLLFD